MAESVVTIWSENTTFTAAVNFRPGVSLKSLWDSEADATKFYGANGTWISDDQFDGSVLTHTGANEFTIDIADTTGILVGMFCYVDDVSAGSNAAGYYQITTVTLNSTITMIDSALVNSDIIDTNDTCSYFIGGVSTAFTSSTALQNELNFIGPACGATDGNTINNLDIMCHAADALTLIATVDVDAISGSFSTLVSLFGTNSSFIVDGTRIGIDTSTTLADGLFRFFNESQYTQWYNFDFNANSNAAYAINNPSTENTSITHSFKNCIFRGATTTNIHIESSTWTVMGCEIASGVTGLFTDASTLLDGCNIHDNTGNGIYLSSASSICCNTVVDNGLTGITGDGSGDNSFILGNTILRSGTHGIHLVGGMQNCTLINNSSSGNGVGTVSGSGYELGSAFRLNTKTFANNHSFGNLDGHCNLMTDPTSDAEFIDFLDRDNVTGDPLFDVDIRPASNSPLLDAGIGGTGDTIGALCAAAGAGGGGAMPLTGPLS
jgi:hypothetical protein